MIRFLGNIEAKADAKGRVFIPAQFRRQLQSGSEDKLIMRKDVFQDCLVLYPEEVWNEELDELRQRLNKWNANHQLIFRQFVSDVEIITMDGNGRILIPKRYLQITGIQSDVRFIGVDNKIEIWAKERAEKLFMEPEAFGAALEEIMKEERRTTNNELKCGSFTMLRSASSSWSNPSRRPPSPSRESISRECPPPPKVTST